MPILRRPSLVRSPVARWLRAATRSVRYPAGATALILAGAAFPSPALRDAMRGAAAEGWHLETDRRYLAAAPLHGVLDQMTLLTMPQHLALLLTVTLLGALAAAHGVQVGGRGTMGRWRTAATGGALALGAMLALCAWGIYGMRPMLRLAGAGPDQIVVDFHAHTQASHDARPGWTEGRLRRWLQGAGFDAAYVTDHGVLWPAQWTSIARGPGGDEPVRLLPGIEVRGLGEHLNILGVTAADAGLFWDRAQRVHLDSLRNALRAGADHPVVLLTSPVKRAEPLDRGLLHAVEISDAAPKGLAFGWRHRPWLRGLADSLSLVALSGSDLHGFGQAAAAWTVLELPGWRSLDPARLDRRIRQTLLARSAAPPLVLERPPLVGTGRPWGVMLTAPLLAHALITRLAWRERLAWLAWSWGTWAAWCLVEAIRGAAAAWVSIVARRRLRSASIWWRRRTRGTRARSATL